MTDETGTADEAMTIAQQALAQQNTHEQICALRYETIGKTSDRMEATLKALTNKITQAMIGIGGCMFVIIMALVFKR